jgi:hypothetical protein
MEGNPMVEFNPCFYCSVKDSGQHCQSCGWTDAQAKIKSLENSLESAGAEADGKNELAAQWEASANHAQKALAEFVEAFENRGETTSLYEWNQRLKSANEKARSILAWI